MADLDLSPLWLSLATTTVATAITFVLGLLVAWRMLGVRNRLRAWLDGLFTLPLILPPTVVGYLLLVFFGARSPVGQWLEYLGITILFSWKATVIAATVVAFPLMYRTALGAMEQVSPTLLDAARSLGASEGRVFFTILLPLAAPGILAGAVLAFARAMGEFGATLMLAGNIPGQTQTLPIAIFSAVEGGNPRVAAFWVVLLVGISIGMIRLLHLPVDQLFRRYRETKNSAGSEGRISGVTFQPVEKRNSSPSFTAHLGKDLPGFSLELTLSVGGEPLGLLGASGAGKSISLRMLAGIVRPDFGRIVLNGRTLFSSEQGLHLPACQRRIGVVFQDYALFPHRTVAENVAYAIHHLPRAERTARVAQWLAALQISHLVSRLPAQISGGERQRTAIARCLAMEPEALLLDEPFAALDPHLRRSTEELLRGTLRNFKGPVLFVTHDMEEAFQFCSELAVVDRGRLLASGPRQKLFENPGSVTAARLTGCKNIAVCQADLMPGAKHAIYVPDWQTRLSLPAEVEDEVVSHAVALGYRSHHFRFQSETSGANVFPCWLIETSESAHEMTLYLRLHEPPGDTPPKDHKAQIQADIPKTQWRVLATQPQPWQIQLVPEQILLLASEEDAG